MEPDTDRSRHLVVKSAHPSSFSARNGFFGAKPFSKTNEFLERHGRGPIDWRLLAAAGGSGAVIGSAWSIPRTAPPPCAAKTNWLSTEWIRERGARFRDAA